MRKFFFILLFLSMFSPICFGQEKSEAFMFYDWENSDCGNFMAIIDGLFLIIANNPKAKAVVIFYNGDNSMKSNLKYEQILNGQVDWRKYNKNQIEIIRAKQIENATFQFWVVPQNAKKLNFEEVNNYWLLPKSTKPFILHQIDHIDYCPSAGYEEQFIKILETNPNALGHLVIYEKSKKKFEQAKSQVLKTLSQVSASKIKFFYVKSDLENVEYWIVPSKN